MIGIDIVSSKVLFYFCSYFVFIGNIIRSARLTIKGSFVFESNEFVYKCFDFCIFFCLFFSHDGDDESTSSDSDSDDSDDNDNDSYNDPAGSNSSGDKKKKTFMFQFDF